MNTKNEHDTAAARLRVHAAERAARFGVEAAPWLSRGEARALLVATQAIEEAIHVPTASGEYAFPSFQFVDGRLAPWVEPLLERIPNGWTVLALLLTPRAALGGRSHLDNLRSSKSEALKSLLADADAFLSWAGRSRSAEPSHRRGEPHSGSRRRPCIE